MSIDEIFDLIVKQRVKEFNGMVATINSVDPITKTCEVTDLRGGIITKVRLIAANTTGMYLIPSVNSVVVVHMISDQDYYVSLFSQLDGITMLDGSFGGLVEVVNLVSKINTIETKLNAVITGTGFGTVIAPITTREDIENIKITHGV